MRTRLGASKEAEKPKEATSLPPAALAASDAEKEQEPVRVAAVPDSPPANATKGELKAWKAAKRVEEIRQAQVAQKKAEEAFESLPTEERFRKLYKEDENKAWDAIVVHVAREREREAREKAASVDPQTAWDVEEEENPFEPLRSKWVGQWSELMRETRELGDKVPERRWGDADVARLEKEEELNGKQSERRNSVE
ncbi:hypothetical protein BT69DRAFT_1281513 [Atractiella rhizophila]|nr:hypothetical protein BT69DRAFT_1281513 [Atractiella rhizophila]